MGRKRHKAEEIVAKLWQVDGLTTQGRSVAEAIRAILTGGRKFGLHSEMVSTSQIQDDRLILGEI